MKARASSLNPGASPYIPQSKGGAADLDKDFSSALELNRGNEAAVRSGNRSENISLPRSQHQNVSRNDGAVPAAADDLYKRRGHRGGEQLTSTSQHVNETMQEEMDLAFLQLTFPGISDECLNSVYLTSGSDLEAAIDMMNQLETPADEPSYNLPDTLDIYSTAAAAQKAKGASNSG